MNFKFFSDDYKSSNSYTALADKKITRIGLLLPFTLTFYGLLVQFDVVKSDNNNVGLFGFAIIILLWLTVAVAQAVRPGNTPFSSALRLLEFYVMSGVYFLLVSGINSPFIFFLPVILIASYNFFEINGIKIGIIALFLMTMTDIVIFHLHDTEIIIIDLLLFTTTVVTTLAIVTVIRTHEKRKAKYFDNIIKKSQQSIQVKTIINNLTDAVFSVSPKGTIRIHNAASLALLDTNIGLKGKNINTILPLTDKNSKAINILDEMASAKGVIQRDDLFYTFEDGEIIRIEAVYTPVRAGYNSKKRSEIIDGYVLILRDVTKPKNIEEERDEFISVISHELRTPITTAEGTISNIQAMLDHPNATKTMITDSISVAYEQIMFLSNIVNDLGVLSRAERGVDGGKEDIDLDELSDKLVGRFSEAANKKKVKLNVTIDKTINNLSTSPVYLEELLKILLNNAVKYTKKGSIDLSITKENDKVTFSVTDTGIGISKTDQPKIFNKFYRSEDYRTRETGGTGLGLYVASRLAQQLGTKINFDSQIEKGSNFYFSIHNNPKALPNTEEKGKD